MTTNDDETQMPAPLLTLKKYMQIWGIFQLITTLYIAFFVTESSSEKEEQPLEINEESNNKNLSIKIE